MSTTYIRINSINMSTDAGKMLHQVGVNEGFVYSMKETLGDGAQASQTELTSLNGNWSITVPADDLDAGAWWEYEEEDDACRLRASLAKSKERKASMNQQVADLWVRVACGSVAYHMHTIETSYALADDAVKAFKQRLADGAFNV